MKNFGGGMPNMQQLMKQAQKMQRQMQQAQEDLATKEFTASAGGGMVEVIMTGDKVVKSIKLNPDVVDADDIETLEDLILVAVNNAIEQVEETTQKELGKFTGGMGGGLF